MKMKRAGHISFVNLGIIFVGTLGRNGNKDSSVIIVIRVPSDKR
jgi:hypothetical protein